MYYVIEGHSYEDEVLSMLQSLYPNCKYILKDSIQDTDKTVLSKMADDFICTVIYDKGIKISDDKIFIETSDIREIKRFIKISILNAAKKVIPVNLPWGILTGIRPAKRVLDMWDKGYSDNQIKNVLSSDYLVSDKKVKLTMHVAECERKFLKNNNDSQIGLYIGIPFCPTRCLYCSFTSYSLEKYSQKVDLYLDALFKEFEYASEYINKHNLQSIYLGGGTPTSLNEKQLDRLLNKIEKYFPKADEFTVEAGRPDTITKEKLEILKNHSVGRISINPQTMNDKTLELIGRKHTVKDIYNAFEMARITGHSNINMDIIMGLPGESIDDVENTLKQIALLNPEGITVHTLAVKRASRLKETFDEYTLTDSFAMNQMLDKVYEYTDNLQMHPYYLYRQKNMIGNYENVGYCKEGFECIYNIQIMEERQTIIALGAGGSTKLVNSADGTIERIFNVKSVDDYILRIDEMINRKKGVLI